VYTNVLSQYFCKATKGNTWFATSKRKKCCLAKILEGLLIFWHQTNSCQIFWTCPCFDLERIGLQPSKPVITAVRWSFFSKEISNRHVLLIESRISMNIYAHRHKRNKHISLSCKRRLEKNLWLTPNNFEKQKIL